MTPQQHGDRGREMKRQGGGAEHPDQTRKGVRRVLQVGLIEEVQRPLERNKPVRVPFGFTGVADDEAARELVEAVQGPRTRSASLRSECRSESHARTFTRPRRRRWLRVGRRRPVATAAARARVLSPGTPAETAVSILAEILAV